MSKNMIIVSDAGPLIGLAKIRRLNILNRLFEKVKIPPSVFHELRITSSRPGAIELKEAIEISKWIEVSDPAHIPHILLNAIEQGEAEAIALAKKEGLVLLIDERRGRKVAKKEKVKITGIGAVLVAAKTKGIIEKVAPALNELLECGYRISEGLRKRILELAEEDDGM
jgi:predicted nucleic acid-binding protein